MLPMTTQIAALAKHECPACGAKAEWNPSTQKLMCPFCGTESPYAIDREQGRVVEVDLVKALRELPEEERGWQIERRSVQCQSCRAVMVFDPARVGQNCEFCGSPALVDYQEIKAPVRPQGVLPFRVDAKAVREQVRQWWRRQWFAPGSLARAALVDTIKSLYIPYWTFDAQAHCPWTAEAGYYYYVNVPGVDQNGRPTVRRERRIRWEPASGSVDGAFDDEAVPGTQGLLLDLLRQVEPFPTTETLPYDTAFLSGHVVEHYQVVLFDAAQKACEQMEAKLQELCAQQVPGDTHRNLQIAPVYSGRTFKHVLVPVWLLKYDYRSKPYQVIVNGCTGTMAGERPYSAWKIALAVLAVVLAAVLFVLLTSSQQ
jgi:Zn finger protein HypA/HybF involved in hydrogenase expression